MIRLEKKDISLLPLHPPPLMEDGTTPARGEGPTGGASRPAVELSSDDPLGCRWPQGPGTGRGEIQGILLFAFFILDKNQ